MNGNDPRGNVRLMCITICPIGAQPIGEDTSDQRWEIDSEANQGMLLVKNTIEILTNAIPWFAWESLSQLWSDVSSPLLGAYRTNGCTQLSHITSRVVSTHLKHSLSTRTPVTMPVTNFPHFCTLVSLYFVNLLIWYSPALIISKTWIWQYPCFLFHCFLTASGEDKN